jgi:hypothetical protein
MGKIHVFLNAGFSHNINLYSKIYQKKDIKFYATESTEIIDEKGFGFGYAFGYMAGGGISLGRWSVECDYTKNRSFMDPANSFSPRRFIFLLGFAF